MQELEEYLKLLVQTVGPNALLINGGMQLLKIYGDVSDYVAKQSEAVHADVTPIFKQLHLPDAKSFLLKAFEKQHKSELIVRTSTSDQNNLKRITLYPFKLNKHHEPLLLIVFDNLTIDQLDLMAHQLNILETNTQPRKLNSDKKQSTSKIGRSLDILTSDCDESVEENKSIHTNIAALRKNYDEVLTENIQLAGTNHVSEFIINEVSDAVILADEHGVIQKCNSAACRLLGATFSALKGQNIYAFLHPSVRDEIRLSDLNALPSGSSIVNEMQSLELENGDNLWVHISQIPIRNHGNDRSQLCVILKDITEQYHTDEMLRLSQRRLKTALDVTELGLWENELQTGEIYWSKVVRDLAGIDHPEKVTYETFKSHVHPDDLEKVQTARSDHLRTKDPYFVNFRFRNASGEYHWCESSAKADFDSKGNVIRFTGTMSNITEKRAHDLEIKTKNSQLILASELASVGYWVINIEDGSLYWSEEVFKIHGLAPNKYKPELKSAIEFYHHDDIEIVENAVSQSLEDNKAFSFQARLKHSDGSYRIVDSVGKPLLDEDGTTLKVFGVFRDVTEEKERERALTNTMAELTRSNYELNRFSYVCSHDMKEPVRMIEMMTSLLVQTKSENDEDTKTELIQRIGSNTARLKAIIDNLLAYSRIDAKVDMLAVNLSEVLNEILNQSITLLEQVDAEIDIGTLPTVFGSKIHFLQLFQNLIGNSLKFNDKKNPIIKIGSIPFQDGWKISVDDNGPGIPVESREKVFNLFSRLKRRDEVEGSGLGLSIVQKIVEQYDGTITCSNSSLGGARFEIYLPAKARQLDEM